MEKERTYFPVAQEEDGEAIERASSDAPTLTDTHTFKPRALHRRRRDYETWVHWTAHTVLTILLVASVLTSGFREAKDRSCSDSDQQDDSNPFIRPSESFYDGIESLAKMQPFYYDREPHIDPLQEKWKGHPNEENDDLWATLSSGKSCLGSNHSRLSAKPKGNRSGLREHFGG
ncbi:hypothetical protein BU26DRAFT_503690 [Trematosphaeria pertusa]|uniref:Uncharacterized protein n=1 Tax=Trematosphaeria pertusa TaxID=390896 RepID=A0A6A6IM28_9PLEO|nr:uncharacterized protein BU26DRAFT_503690 [Trematosphaeria pertusa]KAF2251128.1 hypothetical protein BU26DRAFT_503690 [Trematosphaeria pertusa]